MAWLPFSHDLWSGQTASSDAVTLLLPPAVQLLAFVAAVAFFIILAWVLYCRYFHPYHNIPGPFFATISPFWKVNAALKGTIHLDLLHGHQKDDQLLRIAPDEVSASDPEAIKTIYSSGWRRFHQSSHPG
jgi:hypothetical protein